MKHCFKFTLHLSNTLALLHPTYRPMYAWGKRPKHCMIMNKAELTFLKVRKENEHFLQKIHEATSWWVLPWMVMEVLEIWLLTQSCHAHAAFVKSPLMMNACLSNSCKDVDSPGSLAVLSAAFSLAVSSLYSLTLFWNQVLSVSASLSVSHPRSLSHLVPLAASGCLTAVPLPMCQGARSSDNTNLMYVCACF